MLLVLLGKNAGRSSTGVSVGTTSLSHMYINDLPHNIYSICTVFGDDTSLFSK